MHRGSLPSILTPTFTLESVECFPSPLHGRRQKGPREVMGLRQHVKDLGAFSIHCWESLRAWSAGVLRIKQKGTNLMEREGTTGALIASTGPTGTCLASDSHPAESTPSPAVKRPRAPSIMTYQVTPGPDEDGCVPTITLGDVFVLAPASRSPLISVLMFTHRDLAFACELPFFGQCCCSCTCIFI